MPKNILRNWRRTINFNTKTESTKFRYLRDWDLPEHPEYFYFRSTRTVCENRHSGLVFHERLNYQYHQPQDESENINFTKLYKMTEWIYRTSWKVANEPNRPALLKDFKLER